MPPTTVPYKGEDVANPCRPTVMPEWTDYNDHFNVAYYAQAFDLAADRFRAEVCPGATMPFRTMNSRIDYLREIPGGAELELTTQVLSATSESLHFLQALYAVGDGYLAAIEERIEMPYDPDSGADGMVDAVTATAFGIVARQHAALSVPDGWGHLGGDDRGR